MACCSLGGEEEKGLEQLKKSLQLLLVTLAIWVAVRC